ncbi:MAG TPA: hypothetical protein VFO76_10960 [Candidatus Kapabacteria bacterium]|nr:hypothetical protein [Candidatus Kapabacteria bacterium]
MKRSSIVILLSLLSSIAVAQQVDSTNPRFSKLSVRARADKDSVVLRWAPARPGGWRIANKLGYIVERMPLTSNGGDSSKAERLTKTAIKPWPLDELKNKFRQRDDFIGIAGQVLYGKTFSPPAGSRGSVDELRFAAQELENRFGFAMLAADNSAKAAEVLGLRFVDKTVHEGESYIYRVYTASKDTTYGFDTAYCIVTVKAFEKPAAPEALVAKAGDKNILLEWADNNFPKYSGYYLERSEDGGKTYKPLNSMPIVSITPEGAKADNTPKFTDTTIQNYKQYSYRVYGVNAFGDHSDYAEVLTQGQDFTPPAMPILSMTEQLGMNRVKIKWQMKQPSADLKGFIVSRSDNSLSGYYDRSTLLPPTAREYIDDSASEDAPFYIVSAIDTANNLAPSVPVMASVVDTLPPIVPTGLAGSIDTNGVVHLHWPLSTEKKLRGYRVLWANDLSHEFTQRINHVIEDTVFTDTVSLNTLTQYVYYQIAAVDKRFGHSAACKPIALRRPDKVPPEASVFTTVHNTTNAVVLNWEPSLSPDAAEQILLRKKEKDASWQTITKLNTKIKTYTDESVEQNQIYLYRLDVVDSSGLHSKPTMDVQGRAYDNGKRNTASNLSAAYDQKQNTINLKWNYTSDKKEKYWFVVYRGTDVSALSQYKSVQSSSTSFTDNALIGKGAYKYAIRVLSAIGDSGLSDAVTVQVK